MGPTCSIIYENEPIEQIVCLRKPRAFTSYSFFNLKETCDQHSYKVWLITQATLFYYQYAAAPRPK